MNIIRTVLGGLAAALIATSAQAGKLEIAYWGSGSLQWLQVDGQNYTVDDDAVTIDGIYEGSHRITFGANNETRTSDIYLSSSNQADTNYWCMSLLLDSNELLDGEDCEWMWDDYYGGW